MGDNSCYTYTLFDLNPDAVFCVNTEGVVTDVNTAAQLLAVRSRDELVDHLFHEFITPEGLDQATELFARVASGESVVHENVSIRTGDGRDRVLDVSAYPSIRNDAIVGICGIARDVTDRIEEREELQASERRYRELVEMSPDGIAVFSDGIIRFVNPAVLRILGATDPSEVIGRSALSFTPEHLVPLMLERIQRVHEVGQVGMLPQQLVRLDGTIAEVEIAGSLISYEGQPAVQVVVRDVTDLITTQQALRESEELLRQLTDNVGQIFYIASADNQDLLYLSPAHEEIWGRPRGQALAAPWAWLEGVHPDDRVRVRRMVEKDPASVDVSYRVVRPDGSTRWVHDKSFPVRNEKGEIVRIAGVTQDVTERKALQEQLQQAQKMESVGRLAGGVAHDFNNLLMIILNAAEFVREGISADDPRRRDVDDIVAAGQKGAALVRQLLTYSRQQLVNPKVLDVNDVVTEMKDLLQRSLGEDLILTIKQEPRLLQTRIDPTQLRQVIMNLLVNARDAMGQGGMVTIETSNVSVSDDPQPGSADAPAGRSVCIAVSDTGRGIDPSIVDKIFEPFFSTKPMAEASGLGLSTVYGIVTQAGGRIAVHSEPGVGATFKVYLPAEEAPAGQPATRPLPPKKGGTVLLAEDDPLVLSVASRILSRRGFDVLHAATGRDALQRCKEHEGPIDLLVTDVVMPLMSGRELASHVKILRPETKILYMSGYSEDMIGRHGILQEDENYMQKPFTSSELLEKIETVLRAR